MGLRSSREKSQSKEIKEKQNVTIEESKKLRTPLSEREKRYATKEPMLGEIEEKYGKHKLGWGSGMVSFIPKSVEAIPEDVYLQVADKLKLNLTSGISGTTDGLLTMINRLGFNTKEDMYLGRLTLLGWFIDTKSHSSYEVMTSSKSFGLDFKPSSDFYKQIDPLNTGFEKDLDENQKERGYEMPDFYLKKEYVEEQCVKLGFIKE